MKSGSYDAVLHMKLMNMMQKYTTIISGANSIGCNMMLFCIIVTETVKNTMDLNE